MNCCFSQTWVVCFPAKLCTLGAGGLSEEEEEDVEGVEEMEEVDFEEVKDEKKKVEELSKNVNDVTGGEEEYDDDNDDDEDDDYDDDDDDDEAPTEADDAEGVPADPGAPEGRVLQLLRTSDLLSLLHLGICFEYLSRFISEYL